MINYQCFKMLKNILLVFSLVAAAWGTGEISILQYPDSLLFKGSDKLQSADVTSLVLASMGESIEKSIPFDGFYILDPFNLPTKTVLITCDTSNGFKYSDVKAHTFPVVGNDFDSLDTIGYRLQERNKVAVDVDLSEFDALDEHKQLLEARKTKIEQIKSNLKPQENAEHKLFLEQIAILNDFATSTSLLPSYLHIRVNTINDESGEATKMLTSALEQLANALKGDGLVMVLTTKNAMHKRIRRAVEGKQETDDINLAVTYSDDYPVIFNIILWFGVVLAFSLLAISYAIAYMDPGRDSIIYRMTSARIKKDN